MGRDDDEIRDEADRVLDRLGFLQQSIDELREDTMATLDELKASTDTLTQTVADLATREGGETATNQATIDAAHQNVTAAIDALNAQDQPPTPAPAPAPGA